MSGHSERRDLILNTVEEIPARSKGILFYSILLSIARVASQLLTPGGAIVRQLLDNVASKWMTPDGQNIQHKQKEYPGIFGEDARSLPEQRQGGPFTASR